MGLGEKECPNRAFGKRVTGRLKRSGGTIFELHENIYNGFGNREQKILGTEAFFKKG